MAWDCDAAIIGGGPGGLVSALYLGRFRRRTVLINSGKPRAAWIPKTNNLLGFERGISGPDLLRKLNLQVNRVAVERLEGEAIVRRRSSGGFYVIFNGVHEISARTVLLATGVEDEQPAISNLDELRLSGLLRYCSICDGYDFRDQRIAVLARDDEGIQKALFLRHWTGRIDVLVPETLRIPVRRMRQIRSCGARVLRCGHFVFEPSRSPRGVWVHLDLHRPFFCRAVYVELGTRIRDSAFKGLRGLHRTRLGYLVSSIEQRLSIPGLFAVGDCVNQIGQISVAAGQAAIAATAIHNDLLDY